MFRAALAAQPNAKRYSPPLYWMVVVLISIMGTLISDNLTDNLGVPLMVTAIGASIGVLLSQHVCDGGLGFGTTASSAVFLITILVLVAYLTVTGKDRSALALE